MTSDREPARDDQVLEELVAEALAAHDDGGDDALASYLAGLGERATAVRALIAPFVATGLLARPAADDAFPEQLGEFRLLRRLGAGGMGVVFVAEQTSLRREVALKVVRPEMLLFDGARERFRREVDAIAKLRHPGVVPILAVGEERGIPYFAMELVDGKSGEDLTAAFAGRDPAQLSGQDLWRAVSGDAAAATTTPVVFDGAWWQACARLTAQLAHTMHHAHERGILHRDLKPSNVMVTRHGQALVLDFGLAHVESSHRITRTGSELGSPAYMSPEQLRGEPLDVRTDVYSLGATLYQLLCFAPPFVGRDAHDLRAKILTGPVPRLRARNRAVAHDLETVCLKALDLDRRRRYPSMTDFAGDLLAAAEGRAVRARPLAVPQRLARWANRHRALAVALGAALVFATLLPLLLWQQEKKALEQERESSSRIAAEFARAQRNLGVSREAIQKMLVQLGQVDLAAVPGADQLRARLLEDAVALYQRLLADQSEDPALRADRLLTLEELAKMQLDLGRHDDAEESVAQLVALSGGDALGVDAELLVARTRARQLLASSRVARGAYADAVPPLERKRDELAHLATLQPDDARHRIGLATTLSVLAQCERLRDPGSPRREQLTRDAYLAMKRVIEDVPDDPRITRMYAQSIEELIWLLQAQERYDEALAMTDEKIAAVERLPDDPTARPRKEELLLLAYSAKGSTHFFAGDLPAAAAAHGRSIALAEALARDHPNTARCQHQLGSMLANLGVTRQRLGAHEEAIDLLRRAVAQQRRALELSPELADAQAFLVQHHRSLIRSLREKGKAADLVDAAEDLARDSKRGRDAIDAAHAIVDALNLPAYGNAFPGDRAASLARRAVELLVEAERRGWPEDAELDTERLARLEEVPGYAELRARRAPR